MSYAQRLNNIASSIWTDAEDINNAVESIMYYSDISEEEISGMTDEELLGYMMVGIM